MQHVCSAPPYGTSADSVDVADTQVARKTQFPGVVRQPAASDNLGAQSPERIGLIRSVRGATPSPRASSSGASGHVTSKSGRNLMATAVSTPPCADALGRPPRGSCEAEATLPCVTTAGAEPAIDLVSDGLHWMCQVCQRVLPLRQTQCTVCGQLQPWQVPWQYLSCTWPVADQSGSYLQPQALDASMSTPPCQQPDVINRVLCELAPLPRKSRGGCRLNGAVATKPRRRMLRGRTLWLCKLLRHRRQLCSSWTSCDAGSSAANVGNRPWPSRIGAVPWTALWTQPFCSNSWILSP